MTAGLVVEVSLEQTFTGKPPTKIEVESMSLEA